MRELTVATAAAPPVMVKLGTLVVRPQTPAAVVVLLPLVQQQRLLHRSGRQTWTDSCRCAAKHAVFAPFPL
jgi:hypothetical protein